MVLMQLLWACSLGKQPISTVQPHDVYIVSSLDKLDTRESITVPTSLQEKIVSTMTARGMQPKSLQFVQNYADLRNSEQRLNLYEERPLLLVETQAQFFSQLEGRFRWTVDVQFHLLAVDGTIYTRSFSIPVFHQFHHQRETESIEAAEGQIVRKLEGLLDDYVRGYKP